MPVRVLDLFAGTGGLSLGFEMVRDDFGRQVFELYRAVEIDRYCCETLRNRYGDGKVIEGDLTKKAVHERVITECKGRVSIIVGESRARVSPPSAPVPDTAGMLRNSGRIKETTCTASSGTS